MYLNKTQNIYYTYHTKDILESNKISETKYLANLFHSSNDIGINQKVQGPLFTNMA